MSLPTVRTPGSHLDRARVLQREGPTPSQCLASSLSASDLNTWAHPVKSKCVTPGETCTTEKKHMPEDTAVPAFHQTPRAHLDTAHLLLSDGPASYL